MERVKAEQHHVPRSWQMLMTI